MTINREAYEQFVAVIESWIEVWDDCGRYDHLNQGAPLDEDCGPMCEVFLADYRLRQIVPRQEVGS